MLHHIQQRGAIQFSIPPHPPCCGNAHWFQAESWPERPPHHVQLPWELHPHFRRVLLDLLRISKLLKIWLQGLM